jgi:isopentenyl-diphosphate Delta-isomerase
MSTEQRKKDHLRICSESQVETNKTGFEDVILVNNSLPDLSFNEIDTTVKFFGKTLAMPMIISALTGGTEEAKQINNDLAEVAEKKGIGFSLGSQRAMIDNPEVKETFYVRDMAPNALLLGNVGIFQLKKLSVEKIAEALSYVKADALCVHLNPAQELFQKEGDADFKDSFAFLKRLCKELRYPVIAKEVGFGISREVSKRLKEAGVKAIDVGGFGGTNWIIVDGLISGRDFSNFDSWGIPTPISILESNTGLPLIATGGIRSGLDIAKSISLGSDLCGISLPFLKILKEKGKDGVEEYVDKLHKELKTAMILTDSKNISELKKSQYVLTGKTREWAEQRKLI